MKFEKDVLSDISLLQGRSPTEYIKPNVEPFVDFSMNLVVLVAELLRGALLYIGFRFRSSAVLIVA